MSSTECSKPDLKADRRKQGKRQETVLRPLSFLVSVLQENRLPCRMVRVRAIGRPKEIYLDLARAVMFN